LFAQHREEIRCVITDLTMPGMDGGKFYGFAKIQPNLPVIWSVGTTKLKQWNGLIQKNHKLFT